MQAAVGEVQCSGSAQFQHRQDQRIRQCRQGQSKACERGGYPDGRLVSMLRQVS